MIGIKLHRILNSLKGEIRWTVVMELQKSDSIRVDERSGGTLASGL